MKKYFIFAAIAAAGLLTSCSSSDDAISGVTDPGIENPASDQVPIILGAGAKANVNASNGARQYDFTRGTGTVGDLASHTGTNVWGGQHVWVFMFNKGTFLPSGKFDQDNKETTETILYSNNEMRTPNPSESETGDATEYVLSDVDNGGNPTPNDATDDHIFVQHKYYPVKGNSDFWAYHIDDAWDTNNGALKKPAATYFTGAGDQTDDSEIALEGITVGDNGNYTTVKGVRVPFIINGTQDLMVASAWPVDENEDDIWDGSTLATTSTDFYSAKAARANLQPNLTFQHLLTRLTFAIKGGDAKACGWKETATPGTWAQPAVDADNPYEGVFVKSIKVYSKTDGNLIAAYDYQTAGKPNKNAEDLINWKYTFANAAAYQTACDEWEANSADNKVEPFDVKATKTVASIAKAEHYGWKASSEAAYTAAQTASADNVVDATTSLYTGTSAQDAALLVVANNNKYVKLWVEDTDNSGTFNDGDAVIYRQVIYVPATTAQAGSTAKLAALYDETIFVDDAAWIAALKWASTGNFLKIQRPTATSQTQMDEVPVGSAMMVSTEEEYKLEVVLGQYLLDLSAPTTVEDGETAGTGNHYKLKFSPVTATIKAPAGGFKVGYSYKVLITAYSAEEIAIKATLTGWEEGEDVPVVLE
jgi:hypothetical protein